MIVKKPSASIVFLPTPWPPKKIIIEGRSKSSTSTSLKKKLKVSQAKKSIKSLSLRFFLRAFNKNKIDVRMRVRA